MENFDEDNKNNVEEQSDRVLSTVVVKRYGRHVGGRPERRKDLTALENLKATLIEIKEYLRDRKYPEIREVVDIGMHFYDSEEEKKKQTDEDTKSKTI